MSVADVEKAVAAADATLKNTSAEITVPYIIAALQQIAKTLQEIEQKGQVK